MVIPITYYVTCSVILFFIGIYCLISKRNMIRLLMGLEIMLNAVNLNFIVFSAYGVEGIPHPLAHLFSIIILGVGGTTIALGLVITLYAYRHYGTLNVRKLKRLRR